MTDDHDKHVATAAQERPQHAWGFSIPALQGRLVSASLDDAYRLHVADLQAAAFQTCMSL